MTVRFRAEVMSVDGRRVHFKLEAWDEVEKIAEGEHERFIMDVVVSWIACKKTVQTGVVIKKEVFMPFIW